MGFFDSHSHLNDEKFDEDRDEIIKKIYESGTTNFVTAGYSVESSKKAVDIANNYDLQFVGKSDEVFYALTQAESIKCVIEE